MFFKDKTHPAEISKWGIFAGLVEGMYIGIAAVLLSQQYRLSTLTGWEVRMAFLFLFIMAASGVVATIVVFAHPIYSFMHKQYKDAALTLAVTLLTVIAVYGFIQFTYQRLF